MTDIKTRKLVIGRVRHGGRLVLCDEETGQYLEGQIDLKLESPESGCPKVTVTFDMWGIHGVRFMGEPESEQ